MTHRLHPLSLAAAGVLAFSSPFAGAATVDLDAPGALARLQEERPAQYEAVVHILRDAELLPEPRVEGWVRTRYKADSVLFGPALLVSYPPKRRLFFSLEGVSYNATVVVRLPAATLSPAATTASSER